MFSVVENGGDSSWPVSLGRDCLPCRLPTSPGITRESFKLIETGAGELIECRKLLVAIPETVIFFGSSGVSPRHLPQNEQEKLSKSLWLRELRLLHSTTTLPMSRTDGAISSGHGPSIASLRGIEGLMEHDKPLPQALSQNRT